MDSLITAAARALAAGDPLGALNRVALREDAPALALRGIAMAQLGDFARARLLLRRAARGFGPREAMARARCVVAEAEIALAARELAWPTRALDAARATLEAHGDMVNATHARQLDIRRLLLLGQLDQAATLLTGFDPAQLPPAWRASHELIAAGIAMRRIRAGVARAALASAEQAARQAGIPALIAEVEQLSRSLVTPAACRLEHGHDRPVMLDEVEALFASPALVIDGCRRGLRQADTAVSLATRPLLFKLVHALGEAWPDEVSRDALITRAFGTAYIDDSHRARLRVELGRLRVVLRTLAGVKATRRGYVLMPGRPCEIVVLLPPFDEPHAAVLALLADGEAWSSSALALALESSQRQVQRALDALAAAGKVHALGRGRARRWVAQPVPGFTTSLLLPTSWMGG